MARLPDPVAEGTLSEHGQRLHDELAGPRGVVDGFYRALLNYPELAEKVKDLGTFLRFSEGAPTTAEREVAILTAARVLQSDFIWQKHVPFATQAGIDQETLSALHREDHESISSDLWRAIAQAAAHAARGEGVPDDLQTTLIEALEPSGFIHVVACAAFYRFVAGMNGALDVALVEFADQAKE